MRDEARGFARRDAWRAGREYFEAALEREPGSAEAHAHLGFFCVKETLFDVKRGLAELEAALALDAACVPAYLYRAIALGSTQRLEQAREALGEAERLGASEAELVWARACVELDAGSVREAISGFERLVALERDSTSLILLSQAQSQAGDNAAAFESAKAAFAEDAGDFRAPAYTGVYLAYLGRFDEARSALKRSLELFADFPMTHHALAYIALKEGKTDEAESPLRRALEIDPEYVTSRKLLADLCAASGRVPEAREHYRKALERFPAYSEARAALLKLG